MEVQPDFNELLALFNAHNVCYRISKKLLNASEIERTRYEISPFGHGIH